MGQKVFVQLVQARVCGAHRRLKQRRMGDRERERERERERASSPKNTQEKTRKGLPL